MLCRITLPLGGYPVDEWYFAEAGVENYPLSALASSDSGGNGVFGYGASAFPTNTFDAANYWVDVVFAESAGPDTIPPTVCSFTPGAGANGIHLA